ncbi:hypothetical protein SAMD00019534_022080, partial [Acytostelium subglobosum LB1]|uniref:hypothetical protein n=1 Tax=Acytostelium subglobosum LB1 TaxID=1410327 RepID=UPI0006447C23
MDRRTNNNNNNTRDAGGNGYSNNINNLNRRLTAFTICGGKLNYLYLILYVSLVAMFLFNLLALVLETKDEFNLQDIEDLINREYYDTYVSAEIATIHDQLRIILVCSVFILILLCVIFAGVTMVLLIGNKQRGEEEDSLITSANSTQLTSASSVEKSSIVLEGPMYEPWNVVTIEKISSDDVEAYEKIKSTYYRYGITAGMQIYERCGRELTPEQKKELSWINQTNKQTNIASL